MSDYINKLNNEREYPKIRPLEASLVKNGDIPMIVLKDPQEISSKILMVSQETFFVISLFDGSHSIIDIQNAFNRKFGEILFTNKIEDIIFEMDVALFMDSQRFRQYMNFLEDSFRKSPIRKCKFCGESYPNDRTSLKDFIKVFFDELSPDNIKGSPVGIISPHIDFDRGNRTYAHAYRQLRKTKADIFVIFGTSHYPIENIIALTNKTFNTPLGDLQPHLEIINKIKNKSKYDFFKGEYRHKDEHSIEFQTIMLRYIFPCKNIKIVPVLVSSMDDCKEPLKEDKVVDFIKAFSESIKESNCNPAYIAGVDFAHFGPYFGDRRPPTLKELEKLKEDEMISFKYLEKADAEGFFLDLLKDQETRRVCGLSPIYIMLKVMNASYGHLLEYRRCSDLQLINNVTVAAMSFYN